MNRNLLISILVVILLGAGGFWFVRQGQDNTVPNEDNLINPHDLKVGDRVDVFTVESVKINGEDYEVQLRGEKVIRGKSYLGNAVEGDGTLLCFSTDETREKEPLIKSVADVQVRFCIRGTTHDEYYNQIPADKKNKGFLFVKMRVADPLLTFESWGDTVELLEILEVTNTP